MNFKDILNSTHSNQLQSLLKVRRIPKKIDVDFNEIGFTMLVNENLDLLSTTLELITMILTS